MAPTEDRFAMPERRWDCRLGTPFDPGGMAHLSWRWTHSSCRPYMNLQAHDRKSGTLPNGHQWTDGGRGL